MGDPHRHDPPHGGLSHTSCRSEPQVSGADTAPTVSAPLSVPGTICPQHALSWTPGPVFWWLHTNTGNFGFVFTCTLPHARLLPAVPAMMMRVRMCCR